MSLDDLSRTSSPSKEIPSPPFRWGTRVLLPLALIIATLALLVGTAWYSVFPGVPVRVVPVMVKTVEGSVGRSTVTASGWIEPDPYPTYVTALTDGIVDDVIVLEGSTVKKGSVVARLVEDDARLALDRASADLAIAEAERGAATADLEASREVLAELVDRQQATAIAEAKLQGTRASLAQLAAEVTAEEAKLAALVDEHERKKELVTSGVVAAGKVARLGLTVDAQRGALEMTRMRRPVLESQLVESTARLEGARRHESLLIEERHALAIAETTLQRASATVDRARAREKEAQLRLRRMTVLSPIDGIVMRRLVSPGSRIVTGGETHSGHIVHMYDPTKLQVRVDIPLADAAAIGVDQSAEVTVQVLPDHRFRGKVTRFVHEADIQKNTVEVKVALEDPAPVLKPEMLARIRFLADGGTVETRTRVLVPKRCLVDESNVWVVTERVKDQGIATLRAVEPGPVEIDEWREVISGLQPGDWVIGTPPADLQPGDRVTIQGEDQR